MSMARQIAGFGTARPGLARLGGAGHGKGANGAHQILRQRARPGWVRLGKAGHGKARPGRARHGRHWRKQRGNECERIR